MDALNALKSESIYDICAVLREIIEARNNDIAELGRKTLSVIADYAVGVNDRFIDATGGTNGITCTLPESPIDGQTHQFCKADAGAGAITIDGNGKNINGTPFIAIISQYASLKIVYVAGAGEWRKQL
jgi:hypothetical protein